MMKKVVVLAADLVMSLMVAAPVYFMAKIIIMQVQTSGSDSEMNRTMAATTIQIMRQPSTVRPSRGVVAQPNNTDGYQDTYDLKDRVLLDALFLQCRHKSPS